MNKKEIIKEMLEGYQADTKENSNMEKDWTETLSYGWE
jgi:hypothetical protein